MKVVQQNSEDFREIMTIDILFKSIENSQKSTSYLRKEIKSIL